MTVSNSTSRTSATGSAVAGQQIAFTFPIATTSEVVVYTRVTATGVEATFVETTDYTVSINGDDGGTVTLVAALAATSEAHVVRATTLSQTLDLEHGGAFSAENLEEAVDKVTRIALDNRDRLNRVMRFPQTDPVSGLAELDNSVDRAGKYLYFHDTTGTPTVADQADASAITVSAFAETYLDDADADATMATLQGVSVFNVMNPTYGAVGDGVTDDEVAIEAAITAATVNGGVLYFPGGGNSYKFLTAMTIPSDVILFIDRGGSLLGDGSATLTINGPVLTGRWTMFQSTMTAVFGVGSGAASELFPEWWGAVPDDSTDNAVALQACIDAAEGQIMQSSSDPIGSGSSALGVVSLALGSYQFGTNLTVTEEITIHGVSRGSVLIPTAASGTAIEVKVANQIMRGTVLRDFTLSARSTGDHPAIGLQYGDTDTARTGMQMHNVMIAQFNTATTGVGLKIQRGVGIYLSDCNLTANYVGIQIGDTAGTTGTTTKISNCQIRSNTHHAILVKHCLGLTVGENTIIEGNFGSGIVLDGVGAANAVSIPEYVIIEDCHFESNMKNDSDATDQYYQIYLNQDFTTHQLSIRNNYFLAGSVTGAEIYIEGGHWYTEIVNNYSTDGMNRGAIVQATNEFTFNDNGGSADTITSASYDFVATGGYEAFTWIEVLGSTSNDGIYFLTAVAAGTLTVATGSFTAEAVGATKETIIQALNIIIKTEGVNTTVANNTVLKPQERYAGITAGNGISMASTAAIGSLSAAGASATLFFKPTFFSNTVSADGSTTYTIGMLRNTASAMPSKLFVSGKRADNNANDFADEFWISAPAQPGTITTENFGLSNNARTYTVLNNGTVKISIADPGDTPDYNIRVIGLGDWN